MNTRRNQAWTLAQWRQNHLSAVSQVGAGRLSLYPTQTGHGMWWPQEAGVILGKATLFSQSYSPVGAPLVHYSQQLRIRTLRKGIWESCECTPQSPSKTGENRAGVGRLPSETLPGLIPEEGGRIMQANSQEQGTQGTELPNNRIACAKT